MSVSANKRVLMLLENMPYPMDNRVRREAESLVNAGYRVSVICPATTGQPLHEVVGGVHAYRYPAQPSGQGLFSYLLEYGYSMAATLFLSIVVLFRGGFDVIHAHNPPDTFVFMAVLFKPFGKRFVFDHHDLAPEQYYARFHGKGNARLHKMLLWCERFSVSTADRVIATNESYKKIEMQRDGAPEEKITVVRNGPDLSRLRLVEPDPELRSKAGTIIGYVGVMGVQDGVDYLLRALQHLRADLGQTDFYCVIIGDGGAVPELKELTTALGLDDHVWFTGSLQMEEFLPYLSAADICVDPDPSNAFNDHSTMIKMMEYMALAKPIVAFDLPEHRFTAGDGAIYVQDNDEMEFARQLAHLMDAPEERARLGKIGRQRIEDELSWTHQEKRLLEAYATLLSPAPATRDAVPAKREAVAAKPATDPEPITRS